MIDSRGETLPEALGNKRIDQESVWDFWDK